MKTRPTETSRTWFPSFLSHTAVLAPPPHSRSPPQRHSQYYHAKFECIVRQSSPPWQRKRVFGKYNTVGVACLALFGSLLKKTRFAWKSHQVAPTARYRRWRHSKTPGEFNCVFLPISRWLPFHNCRGFFSDQSQIKSTFKLHFANKDFFCKVNKRQLKPQRLLMVNQIFISIIFDNANSRKYDLNSSFISKVVSY